MPMSTSTSPIAVPVRGGFADVSALRGVIPELGSTGYSVHLPPNPSRGRALDATTTARNCLTAEGNLSTHTEISSPVGRLKRP
jgi:hypothetical protein